MPTIAPTTNIVFECPATRVIGFDEFSAGDFVGVVADGLITVTVDDAQCSTEAMIFDTANPPDGDKDLGAPNSRCNPPGPGVGSGGNPGDEGENCQVQGNALIISEDCNSSVPNDQAAGGIMTLHFAFPTYVEEIGLIDQEEITTFVVTKDSGEEITVEGEALGNNSFQKIIIDQSDVTKIVVILRGSGAIPYLVIENQCPKCPATREISFDEFDAGDLVGDVADGLLTVSADDPDCNNQAMIFDTENPTGDDADLGTPNMACDPSGPGEGQGGRPGKEGENCVAQGKALIISEDCDPGNPDDQALGGTLTLEFNVPTFVYEIGLIDQEDITTFVVTKASGDVITVLGRELGDNSFQAITINQAEVTKIETIFVGSGAIPYLVVEDCPH